MPEIVGRGQVSFTPRFEYVEGNPNDNANKARHSQRAYPVAPHVPQKEEFRLEYGDSGNTVYMAVQLENGDMKGPFGPMISAVIPCAPTANLCNKPSTMANRNPAQPDC